MTCPACGQVVAAGQERCPACASVVAPPVEGALAADPRLVTPPARGHLEPLRELPGTRKRERTWKDEVRERVEGRKRQRAGSAELPLFREEGEESIEDLEDLVGEPAGSPAVPAHAAVPERLGIHELGDEDPLAPAPGADDLPLRPLELEPAEDLLDGARPASLLDEPPPLDLPVHPRSPLPGRRIVLDEEEEVEAPRDPEAESPEEEGSREWTLDAPPRSASPPVERPAGWVERFQAAVVDLTLLCGLWAVVVYFASRAAHVPISGLRPAWPYLVGYLAFLGLIYAAYFTGATGQTLGKIVTGLRVVDRAGQPPGYLRAFVRAALGALGIALLFGGVLPIFLDPARRALHDRLLRTRVVKG